MNRKLIGVLVILCGCGDGQSTPTLTMGSSAVVMIPGLQEDVLLGTSADNYSQLSRYMMAKDVRGMYDLLVAGKAFAVSPRTKCIVNGRPGFGLISVRIMEGQQNGREGVVAKEYVIPDGGNGSK